MYNLKIGILILNLVLCLQLGCSSTTNIHNKANNKNKDCDFIYWKPNVKITYKDFNKDSSDTTFQKYHKKYGFNVLAAIQLMKVLDIPKDDEDYILFDKVYIAPAFCKKHSITLTQDSVDIAKQLLYFDICECFARLARKEFKLWQDSLKADNIISMLYTTIMNDVNDRLQTFTQAYTEEIYITKVENAFEKYQAVVNEILIENEEYATRPEDCRRFITGEPVDKRYKEAKFVIGDLTY
jgi:hypothetical protein